MDLRCISIFYVSMTPYEIPLNVLKELVIVVRYKFFRAIVS